MIESLKPFFNRLVELSADEPNTRIFLAKYVEVGRAIQTDKSIVQNDGSLKLKAVLNILAFFRHAYFNLYILPKWENVKVEKVNERVKRILDEASISVVPLMFTHSCSSSGLKHDGFLQEFKALDNKSLTYLKNLLRTFLGALPFIGIDYPSTLTDKEKEDFFLSVYLSPFFNLKSLSQEKNEEAICFYIALGVLLYIENELWERLIKANRINPKDKRTQASPPCVYSALELAGREENKNLRVQKIVLDLLEKGAEMRTKGIYHPDDPECSKWGKFFTEEETEAKSSLGVLISEKLYKHNYHKLSIDELYEKMFQWNEDLVYTPNRVLGDLLNKIESQLAKKTALTIRELREIRNAIKKIKKLIKEGKASPEELEQAQKQFKDLSKKEISIVLTDQEDFEGIPTEKQVSNEMVEYVIKNPETYVMYWEERERCCSEIQDWAERQPKQAHLSREVADYIQKVLYDPTADFKEAFKVTKIVKTINTSRKKMGNTNKTKNTSTKEVRSVRNKIIEEIPSLKDLLIPS